MASLNSSVGIFTLNTEGLRFCSRLGQTRSLFIRCVPPDFVKPVCDNFRKNDCDIIVVGLEESAMPGDNLLDAFTDELKTTHTRIYEDYLLGAGQEGFLGFIRGLRIALYLNKNLLVFEANSYKTSGNSFRCGTQTLGKGALAVNLDLQYSNNSTLQYTFIVAHLPFVAKADRQGLTARDTCLNGLKNKIIDGKRRDHIFIFGDLNYRIEKPDMLPGNVHTLYTDEELLQDLSSNPSKGYQYDQLHNRLQTFGLREGDIKFLPTCKLNTGRSPGCNTIGCYDTGKLTKDESGKRTPSWCDRVLYASQTMKPVVYDSVNTGNITKSDHAAVIAIFK